MLERARLGRRARSLVSVRKGKYARHRLARAGASDLALDATLRAAAVRGGRTPVSVEAEDLCRKIREHRSPFAVCFVVDNSYSVHAERMVEKVKGLAFGLLVDARKRGDKVGLVAFKGGVGEATVALPLTRSMALAHRRLEELPLSGRTPLADALRRARLLLRQETIRHPNAVPLVVVVTDGLPTVPLGVGGDPVADVIAQGRELRRARVLTVIAEVAVAESCAEALARASDGVCLPLAELAPEVLDRERGSQFRRTGRRAQTDARAKPARPEAAPTGGA